jgi:mevalonate pyrophosphate decarboxylase
VLCCAPLFSLFATRSLCLTQPTKPKTTHNKKTKKNKRAETMEKLRYLAVMEWLQGTVKVNTVPFGGGGGDGGSGSSSGSAAAAAAAGAAA